VSDIRVILADDHALVRAGIHSLLESLDGIDVIAEASDGREAIELIQQHQPDVVLMDISMSGLNGLEAAAYVVKEFPGVKVIMLSMHANEEYVLQALRAGASGYLLKNAGILELELAVKSVARGEIYLSPPISKHIISDYVLRVGGELDKNLLGGRDLDPLTLRQREILQLIAEGHTTQDIAQKLNISIKTVETHRMQIMERLDIHDVAGLVRYAIRIGLISPDE